VLLEQRGDLRKRRLFGGRHDVGGHHFVDGAAVALGELGGERGGRRDGLEPPRAMPFGAHFGPAHKIGLTDDPDYRATVVDHGKRTDVVLVQELDGHGDFVVGLHRDHVAHHDVGRLHVAPLRINDGRHSREQFGYGCVMTPRPRWPALTRRHESRRQAAICFRAERQDAGIHLMRGIAARLVRRG
jgi:hypothetical protein